MGTEGIEPPLAALSNLKILEAARLPLSTHPTKT